MQLQVRIYFLDGKMIKLKSGNNTSGIGMYVQYVSTIHLYSPSVQHRIDLFKLSMLSLQILKMSYTKLKSPMVNTDLIVLYIV